MPDFSHCARCGELRYSVSGRWKGDLCIKCRAASRVVHTTRKCAGCDVMIDLRALPKRARGRVKYHDHECYGRHRTALYLASTPAEKPCAVCGVVCRRDDYTPTKWSSFRVCPSRRCSGLQSWKARRCANPKP